MPELQAAAPTVKLLVGGCTGGQTTASVTRWYALVDSATSHTNDAARTLVGAPCTITEWHVKVLIASPTGNCTLTVRKNGVATALAVTVAGGTAVGTVVPITGQSVSFAMDDDWDVEVTSSATVQGAYAYALIGTQA